MNTAITFFSAGVAITAVAASFLNGAPTPAIYVNVPAQSVPSTIQWSGSIPDRTAPPANEIQWQLPNDIFGVDGTDPLCWIDGCGPMTPPDIVSWPVDFPIPPFQCLSCNPPRPDEWPHIGSYGNHVGGMYQRGFVTAVNPEFGSDRRSSLARASGGWIEEQARKVSWAGGDPWAQSQRIRDTQISHWQGANDRIEQVVFDNNVRTLVLAFETIGHAGLVTRDIMGLAAAGTLQSYLLQGAQVAKRHAKTEDLSRRNIQLGKENRERFVEAQSDSSEALNRVRETEDRMRWENERRNNLDYEYRDFRYEQQNEDGTFQMPAEHRETSFENHV